MNQFKLENDQRFERLQKELTMLKNFVSTLLQFAPYLFSIPLLTIGLIS